MIPATRFRAGRRRVAASFVRQRMNKVGLHAATPSTFYQVADFASDATYPADVSGGNSMRVDGTGPCTLTAHCVRAGTFGMVTFQLRVNGNPVGSDLTLSGATPGDITWTGTLTDGDWIDLWQRRTKAAGSSAGATDGTYIDVHPT